MKTLKGKLTICRIHGSKDDGHVSIEVKDQLSGCQVIEVRVGLTEFAEALFAFACQPCEFDHNDSDVVGMKRELKKVLVFVADHEPVGRAEVVREAVAAHEIDGWKGRDEDAGNMHYRRGRVGRGTNYEVTFTRFVPAEETN